jgi:ABC-type polysaccharide/polyol phosphate transport system ATPase subunit
MCTAAMWLDKGKLMMEGDPETVVEEYKKFTKVKKSAATEDEV